MKLGGWVVMFVVMSVFFSIIGIEIAGLGVINNAFSIDIDSETSQINDADLEDSSFWSEIFGENGILVLLGVTGLVVIGLFGRGYDPSLVLAPFIVFIGGLFSSTAWSVISYVSSEPTWVTWIVAIIFIGLGAGFIMSCVDYFAGR